MNRLLHIVMSLSLSVSVYGREKTVDDRVAQFGSVVEKRLAPFFAAASVPYPPARVTLIGFKQERVVQLYAAGTNGLYRIIRSYPILAASGKLGPKLREGDAQVPEGLYRIESLNPNSRFHLSLRLNYPNEFDRAQAQAEGRRNPGSDIMIHGNAVSIGCLAMGDSAAEELFVLAARTGLRRIAVILSPVDFRCREFKAERADAPPWLRPLYDRIKTELTKYDTRQGAEPVHADDGKTRIR
ncbi:MAG: L,D-transpeptidase family protein [Kiritimatiellaeota bacterium]|nr:L,D-transpeptidase family protein [Kiritimatiellota bacterium]